jgi:hypothetical protein
MLENIVRVSYQKILGWKFSRYCKLHNWRLAIAPGCYESLTPLGNVITYEHIDEIVE